MKDKTRKITLIVLICIAMIGSFLTLTVFSFVKSSDAFTESFNGSIERAYEQSDKSQSLEELKETSEKGMDVLQKLIALTIVLQIIILICAIKGPNKNRIALIYLSILNLILSFSLISIAILVISCLKSKDIPYEKPIPPEVENVSTFKLPVYIISFLAIWVLIYNGILIKVFPQIKEWGVEHDLLFEVLFFLILFTMVLILLRKELIRDFKLLNLVSGIIVNQIVKEQSENQALLNEMPLWFMIIFGTIIGPMVEEGIYRGLLGKIIKNKIAFVILSAAMFGAMHVVTFTSFPKSPMQYFFLIQYGVMGIVLATNYARTKNIFSSYLIHMFMNGTATVLTALILL